MNKYRIIGLITLLCFVVSLLVCNSMLDTSEKQSATEPEGITTCTEETATFIEEITEEELKKVNSDIKVIIQSLNDRDVESMKTLFDDATLQKITAFDEKMEYAFDMLDGNIIKTEERELKKIDESGLVVSDDYYIYISYDIYTEASIYPLDVVYVCNKKMKVEDTGVYSIEISDFDREHIYYKFGYGWYHWIPGVFSTEIETIEYNSNELWSYFSKMEQFEPEMSILAGSTAVELSKAGIEKIHIENLEVNEEGCMLITLVDEINFKYFVKTDEYGYVYYICENDSKGRTVYYKI